MSGQTVSIQKLAYGVLASALAFCACTGRSGAAPDAPVRVSKVLFLGDTSHGESYHAKYEVEGKGNIIREKGYDYSLAQLKPILLDADYVIANVETPLTDLRDPPFPDKGYNHWSDPAPATDAYRRHGIDAVSLANNHTLDFAKEGLFDTLHALDSAGIDYFGAARTKADADAPLHVLIGSKTCPVHLTVFGRFEFRQSYADLYDFYAGDETPGASALILEELIFDIKAERAKDPNQLIIVYPHWGKNYKWKSEKQVAHAQALAAAGADLVLGHGAHTAGEIDKIGDSTIVYSLGNFMFNTWGRFPDNPEVLPMSLIAQLSLAEQDGEIRPSLRLYPIYSDNCVIKYQPRFVTASEFERAYKTLREKVEGEIALTSSQDEFGYFIETPLEGLDCSAKSDP